MGKKGFWPALLLSVTLLACTPSSVSPVPSRGEAAATPPGASPTPSATTQAAQDPFAKARQQMIEYHIAARGIKDELVLKAMAKVPREKFVLPEDLDLAYADRPLPIGYGQTISQPYIVALMTELLQIGPGSKVLEIGTGSGYQAAILAEITDEVYSVEIIPELAESAAKRLRSLGYDKVHLKQGDGYYGWEEHAPYDAIIVTAAPDHIPQPLVQQLKDGGRLVIPVGPVGGFQTLWRITKEGNKLRNENMGEVIFVPLTGKH